MPERAHLHAEDDEQLVQAAMGHVAEVHPDMPFPESAAREFVQNGAYDDTQHATGASG
jgi:hypothetical protein